MVSGDDCSVNSGATHHQISLILIDLYIFFIFSLHYLYMKKTFISVTIIWSHCNRVIDSTEIPKPILANSYGYSNLDTIGIMLENAF